MYRSLNLNDCQAKRSVQHFRQWISWRLRFGLESPDQLNCWHYFSGSLCELLRVRAVADDQQNLEHDEHALNQTRFVKVLATRRTNCSGSLLSTLSRAVTISPKAPNSVCMRALPQSFWLHRACYLPTRSETYDNDLLLRKRSLSFDSDVPQLDRAVKRINWPDTIQRVHHVLSASPYRLKGSLTAAEPLSLSTEGRTD